MHRAEAAVLIDTLATLKYPALEIVVGERQRKGVPHGLHPGAGFRHAVGGLAP
jgi:hypothetical protein